ncbi:hypothetical protein [Brasilonema bromeliae]|uniref:Uncharacterized protein n=1 Tax=Brasilonema bromeliae SPC951 TaxID=385972 RepID=A0ABX1P9P8_9CYAN|nr:hypothetical protein [Brasilonema bromeliae]NMG20703.1 hypothetical protein [Brasilonema bromeliae SPC951]
MNNKDFDAFMAISGIEPPKTETKVQAPQPKASDNFFGAPSYRGEDQRDLTEDERRAESTDRSDVDDLTSKQNFSGGVSSIGTGLTITIGISSVAGTSGAGLGLGVGLVGCLIFGTEAATGKKASIVRLGAMTIGTGYAGCQLWNYYAQNSAVGEINHSVELYMVKQPQSSISLGQIATWGIYAVVAIAIIRFLLSPKTRQQKTTSSNNPLNF